jgi:hypothetical protein
VPANKVGFMNKSIISSKREYSVGKLTQRSYKTIFQSPSTYNRIGQGKKEVLSSKTEKIILQKFNKEFTSVLQEVVGSE